MATDPTKETKKPKSTGKSSTSTTRSKSGSTSTRKSSSSGTSTTRKSSSKTSGKTTSTRGKATAGKAKTTAAAKSTSKKSTAGKGSKTSPAKKTTSATKSRAATQKRTATRSRTTSPSPRQKKSAEPFFARVLQSILLVLGIGLLFTVFFGGKWGPILIGLLLFGTAFPPIRKYVDKWLVGKTRGDEANTVAALRMGGGMLILVLAVLGVFSPG